MRKQYTYFFLAIACLFVAAGWIHSGLIRTNGSNDFADDATLIAASPVAHGNPQVIPVESAGFSSATTKKSVPQTETSPTKITTAPPQTEQKKNSYIFAAKRSETVLDAMRDYSSFTQFDFKTKEFPGLGVMIEEINGLKNGDGYYWILYINGKDSAKGASAAQVQSGDTIEWKYEKGY